MLASALMIATTAGCAAQTAYNPKVPLVQDCVIMNVSSPTKFVCNNKTYTTFQLAKMRMAEEKKYASGK
jgi:hypothetical protein